MVLDSGFDRYMSYTKLLILHMKQKKKEKLSGIGLCRCFSPKFGRFLIIFVSLPFHGLGVLMVKFFFSFKI